MQWDSFWAQFEASIESHECLSDVRKLAYLRKAITDPDTSELLRSGAETGGLYAELVALLKLRFDRTREIHRNHCHKLVQFGTVKHNRADLRKFVDTASTTVASIKRSGHYNLDAFLTSILYNNISIKLQTLWEQHSKKDKGIPPVAQFLEFVSEHAETLPAPLPTSGRSPEVQSERKNNKKPERRQDPAPYKHMANIHVATPTSNYKWECPLCKPEKHPLFLCPK